MENQIHSEKGGNTNGRAWKTNGKQGKKHEGKPMENER